MDEGQMEEGQLALDVYQTDEHLYIVAPVAGVPPEDISVEINDEVLSIQGKREFSMKKETVDHLTQECFWGSFARSIVLPPNVNTNKMTATFKHGILTIKIPKVEQPKSKNVKIKVIE